jgi:predicted DNA-binding transcriptional regulator YafY
MGDVEVSDEKAAMPIDFNSDLYFKHAVGITVTTDKPLEVVFKANNLAAKYLDSQPLHPSQKLVKEGNKRTTFELFVLITEELIRNLMSYGDEIEVLEPEVLRNEIQQRVASMVARYKLK